MRHLFWRVGAALCWAGAGAALTVAVVSIVHGRTPWMVPTLIYSASFIFAGSGLARLTARNVP